MKVREGKVLNIYFEEGDIELEGFNQVVNAIGVQKIHMYDRIVICTKDGEFGVMKDRNGLYSAEYSEGVQ